MKRNLIIVIAAILAIALIFMSKEADRLQREGMPVHGSIFEDIQELEQALSPYRAAQAPEDPALGALDYTHALQWIVEKDGVRFTVYAYTFADRENAKQYRGELDNCINTTSDLLRSTTEYLARYRANVLYIVGGRTTGDFVNWLETHLPIKEKDILSDGFDEARALYQSETAAE